jgi:hypothetical protein
LDDNHKTTATASTTPMGYIVACPADGDRQIFTCGQEEVAADFRTSSPCDYWDAQTNTAVSACAPKPRI